MAVFQTKDKAAPHVDMTPMVDLGFLLITFFMLASSFLNPKSIKMDTPSDGMPEAAKCSQTLTLLFDGTDKVKYYVCPESGPVDSFDFSNTALRDLLLKRQHEVALQWGDKNKLAVLIKPSKAVKYQRVIDAIDNMRITQSPFVLAKLEEKDSVVLKLK